MENISEEQIDREIEILKMSDNTSSKLYKMPIIRDIIGFELSKCEPGERREFFISKPDNNSWNLGVGTVIPGEELNFKNMEYYHIKPSGDKVTIEVGYRGRVSKDGIRVTADKEGNMLRAEFVVEDSKVELPTPNKRMRDLERFIKYQREIESMSEKALFGLFQTLKDKKKYEEEVKNVKTNMTGIRLFIASDFEKLSSNKKQLFFDVIKEIDNMQEDKNKGNSLS